MMTLADAIRYVQNFLACTSTTFAILFSQAFTDAHFVVLAYDLLPTSRLRTFHIVEIQPRCWEMKEEVAG